ncbi:UNVERIFIED_CONTAM: hypothetical protein PYX00_001258 [Menopon gallinae]|uniref:Glutaredoxin domain-containing protein n=1 Tax=Menopon gallinae TaxID=328185 RepID=A0AAW2IDE6_9NEOP
MAARSLLSVSGFLKHPLYDLSRSRCQYFFVRRAYFTTEEQPRTKKRWQSNLGLFVGVIGAGALVGSGYAWYSTGLKAAELEVAQMNEAVYIDHTILPKLPDIPISRHVKNKDETNLKLTLFQYPTCPFCCKVRAFLDYYGISYDVVEVDPVLRQQTKWTTYKKVPILLVKTDEGYQQLNDSTMIISALTSFLHDKKMQLSEILDFYPVIEYKNQKGEKKTDVLNRYFLMFQESVPKGKMYESVKTERQWREWADDVLVHTLSPNVYRTPSESLQAFTWFSEVGEWDRLFPAWERAVIVYVGAAAMWIVGKMLRKRHHLKDDVRESLYDECRKWMKAVKTNGTTFLGGNSPNLADLAVYGVLSSIEGCNAFKDLLKNTSIGNWYYPMKESVSKHNGKPDSIVADLHNMK